MKPDRDIGAMFLSFLLVLAASVVLRGCGGSDSQQSQPTHPLPANPQDWVCQDTTITTQEEIDAWCQSHPDRGRPVPPDLRDPPPPADFANYELYNERLKTFLTEGQYTKLGWVYDMNWRFSGPSVVPPTPAPTARPDYGHNYGPHFPLRVYYSPEVVNWLCNGRQGVLPNGAMMVKTMNISFDTLHIEVASDGCMKIIDDGPKPIEPSLWAPMLKSSQSSHDGWLWMLQQPDIVLPPPFPPVLIPPQFPPPLLDASAFTGGDFPTPIKDNPLWYPTGSILNGLQLFTKIPNVVTLIPLAGIDLCFDG
jgi:hypothetical protein